MRNVILVNLLLLLLYKVAIAQEKNTLEVPKGLAVCTFGPPHTLCKTNEYVAHLDSLYPEYATKRAELEIKTEKWIAKNGFENVRSDITIPVVVHVVYNVPEENISDAQINAQITRLNLDFNSLNSDVSNVPTVFQNLIADCGIHFALTNTDPNGLPTTGITRTSTSITAFTGYDDIKFTASGGIEAWDTKHYLNIWVGDIAIGSSAAYASLPGGPQNSDGMVCDYKWFGTGGQAFAGTLGRSVVHEMGHYLNLLHIWGNTNNAVLYSCTDSDNVEDTPNQEIGYVNTCPPFPRVSCSNGPNGDMFMNYMDYTTDVCKIMFTKGQRARMYAALFEARSQLIQPTNGCLASHNITTTLTDAVAKYEADDFITASNVINPTSAVIYDAQNYIVLQDGFWAKESSDFRAVTGDGCGGDIRLAMSPVLTNNTTLLTPPINGFAVYPNPATDNITISYNLDEASDVQLRIYNVLGEVVKSQFISNVEVGVHNYSVNLDDIPMGIYLFSLNTKQGLKTARIVKN